MSQDPLDPLWTSLYRLRTEPAPEVLSLWSAVKSGDLDLAQSFIDEGHDVNARVMGGSALSAAARDGNPRMIELLLAAGARASIGNLGSGPLASAVHAEAEAGGDRTRAMALLFKAGVIDDDLRAALQAIAHAGNGPLASQLVAAARTARIDEDRLSRMMSEAADHARERGNEQLAQFLGGESDDAGENADLIGAEVAELLGGVDISDADAVADLLGLDALDAFEHGPALPPMASGAERDDIERELCRTLRNGELDDHLRSRNLDRETPIEFAASHGLHEVLDALIAAGVSPAASRDDVGALYEAARGGHTRCISALIAAGADADDVGRGVYTPLVAAAEHGHLDAVRMLLDAGANPRFRTQAGETAMMRSAGLHVFAIRDLMRQHAERVPSDTERGLKSAGKNKPCAPRNGVRAFMDAMLGGHPEWVLLAVRAPIEEVTAALEEVWRAGERMCDVARVTVPEADGAFAWQLKDHAWTVVPIAIGDYRIPDASLADDAADALSSRLDTMALAFYAEDTSGAIGVRSVDRGVPSASLNWDGGQTIRYDGAGEAPAGRNGKAQLERYFADLELFVPSIEIASDGFDQQLVLRNVGLKSVARVDFLPLERR